MKAASPTRRRLNGTAAASMDTPPTTWKPSDRRSSVEWKDWSICTSRKASPAPAASPATSTPETSRMRLGATGTCGTVGGSITWILTLSPSASAAVEMRMDSRRAVRSS